MDYYLYNTRRNRFLSQPVGSERSYIIPLNFLGGQNTVPYVISEPNNYQVVSTPSYSQITISPILHTTPNANTTIDITNNSTVGSPTDMTVYANLGSVTISQNILGATITKASHGLVNGTQLFFTTTGTLPAPLKLGSTAVRTPDANTYYIVNSATNTFQIATSPGGVEVGTSSAGSGTHYTYYRTL